MSLSHFISEAVERRCSVRKCVSFLIKLQVSASACDFIKKEILERVFSCEFCEISKDTFLQNISGGRFCHLNVKRLTPGVYWKVIQTYANLQYPYCVSCICSRFSTLKLVRYMIFFRMTMYFKNFQCLCHSRSDTLLCYHPIFTSTAWKVLNYGVISGPYFPVFSPNTGQYEPEITPYLDTFQAVFVTQNTLACLNFKTKQV